MSLEHWQKCYNAIKDDTLCRKDSTWGSVASLQEYICHGYIKWLELALETKPNYNQTVKRHIEVYGDMYGKIKPEIEKTWLHIVDPWPEHWHSSMRLPTSVYAHTFLIMRVYINNLELQIKYNSWWDSEREEEIEEDIYPEMTWHG